MPPELPALTEIGLHDGVRADGWSDLAAAARVELLRFPHWKAMRLGGAGAYSFQTCITTGHIQGRYPELVACHRFEDLLAAQAPALCTRVGADPAPPIRVEISAMAYGEDGRLKVHSDDRGARRVAWIFYLTRPEDGEWTGKDGGELLLSDGAGRSVAVFPRFNRFVAFRVSIGSLHEILPVRRATDWEGSRLALAGWLVGDRDGDLHTNA